MIRISFTSVLLSALFLSSAFSLSFSLSCTRHSHCDDGESGTLDICLHTHNLCLSFRPSRQVSDNDLVVERTLPDLIAETDRDPIPVADKVATALTAAKVIGELNPNVFLHRNLLGVDVVQDLEKFADSITDSMSNFEFHAFMAKIFQRMDDAHTVYLTTAPLNTTIATLGIEVKQFFDMNDLTKEGVPRRRYVVTDVEESVIPKDSKFGPGSELLTYNGARIDVAAKSAGIKSYGSNTAAQLEFGTILITYRPLIASAVPLEPNVEIEFRNLDGTEGTVTLPWMFLQLRDNQMVKSIAGRFTPLQGKKGLLSKLVPKSLADYSLDIRSPPKSSVRVSEEGRVPIPVAPEYAELFSAEVVPTKFGSFGRLVLKSFQASVSIALLEEFSRVLSRMPTDGLIVDARSNSGGDFVFTKFVAELITNKTVPDQPSTLRATKLMQDAWSSLDIGETSSLLASEVSAISVAIDTAIQAGEQFSGPTSSLFFPFSKVSVAGTYAGPVVTVIDGLTYSSGDEFAALQVDQGMSVLVGTADRTGGGGAASFSYTDLAEVFSSVLEPLPSTVNYFTTAVNRFYRSGRNKGAIVENFGVEPDIRYYPSYNDAVTPDCDLLNFLGQKLVEMASGIGNENESPEAEAPESPEALESPEEVVYN